MLKELDAIYENGVLRPLEPLDLPEKHRVHITLEESIPAADDLLDLDYLRSCESDTDPAPPLEAVRTALSKIPGSLTEDFAAERAER